MTANHRQTKQQQQQQLPARQVCFDLDPPSIVSSSCRSSSPNTISSSSNSIQFNGHIIVDMNPGTSYHHQQQVDDNNDSNASSSSNGSGSISSTKHRHQSGKTSSNQGSNNSNRSITGKKSSSNSNNPNDGNDDGNAKMAKNSPRHLLYEVLLSPIKRKSRNKTTSATTSSTKQSSSNHDSSNKNDTSSTPNNVHGSDSRPNRSSSSWKPPSTSAISTSTATATTSNRSQSTTPLDRNYYHFQTANPTSLFDEDPGIMSEIETSATGFRRNNKIRTSLPIVRTPSKSQDRSLGLVFLQFRSETKRALLPNEITSIDTVRALFVRSFPRQLTMEYMDHISVRIYIHDPNKDMFYELEDLRDVKDRCILRIYEQGVNGPQPAGGIIHQSLLAQTASGLSAATAVTTGGGGLDGESYGYFSEPEFDSEYQSQHIHRKRFPPPPPLPSLPMVGHGSLMAIHGGHQNLPPQSQYYGTIMLPPQYRSATLGPRSSFFINQNLTGQQAPQPPARNKSFANFSQTLPRGTHLMSANPVTAAINPFGININSGQAPPPPKPQRQFPANPPVIPQPDIIMIQGLQARPAQQALPPSNSQEAQSVGPYHQNRPLPDRPYSVAGHYPSIDRTGARFPFTAAPNPNNVGVGGDFPGYLSSPEHRPPLPPANAAATLMSIQTGQLRATFPGFHPSNANTRLFDSSMAAAITSTGPNSNAYGTRHPVQPSNVIDDEARARMQEMERKIASLTNVVSKALTTGGPKPPPPPKPPSLVGHRSSGGGNDHGSTLSADNLTQLRQIRRKARDLRSEVRQLKRFTVQQINSAKETINESCHKIQLALSFLTKPADAPLRLERIKVSCNCDSYNEDALRLDKDLLELEAQVEALRSNVINRRCRVNMSNVESMALILSRASKTVADLKARYPSLAQNLKSIMSRELHEIEKEEKFLKEEPERLEHSLKRCKKLTGTLVTLKRLASVQEQRSSSNANTSSPSQMLLQSTSSSLDKKDIGSGDETSGTIIAANNSNLNDSPLMTRAKRMQRWRRSANFHQTITSSHNHKIDLCRGFRSMPTIQEPYTESVDDEDENVAGPNEHHLHDVHDDHVPKVIDPKRSSSFKSYDAVDLMEPHTIIQVTPATPSSTDSSQKTTAAAAATTNMLDNLLDELQTFSKQSSMDSREASTPSPLARSSLQRTGSGGGGSFRAIKPISTSTTMAAGDSDTIIRKASRSKSYSSIRATSEPPGARSRGSSIPDGKIDFDNIALLASTCGNVAAATAALVEKRFAQSRQELLEKRHQELLHKQRQLQEQYTRLQQLSKRPIGRGLLNDLKKTGSESNIVLKASGQDPIAANITTKMSNNMGNNLNDNSNKMGHVLINSTVHGSLHNIASSVNTTTTSAAMFQNQKDKLVGAKLSENGNCPNMMANNNDTVVTRKAFETDIL